MRIFQDIFRELNHIPKGAGLAMGNFDGLHKGHLKLIRLHLERCRALGIPAGLLTFSNHTGRLLKREAPLYLLMNIEEKTRRFEALGFDFVIFQRFDEEFASISPEAFVREILFEALKVRLISVGENFRYGQKGLGNAETLEASGNAFGFEAQIVPLHKEAEEVVSSSRIRAAVRRGDMAYAERLLGKPFSMKGTVTYGRHLGSRLGFPTLNLVPDEGHLTPHNGVYITETHALGKEYPSITNVGVKPTVGSEQVVVETHLLDFEGDLYEKPIEVFFLSKLRDEVAFGSIEALKAQIDKDRIKAVAYFEENLPNP